MFFGLTCYLFPRANAMLQCTAWLQIQNNIDIYVSRAAGTRATTASDVGVHLYQQVAISWQFDFGLPEDRGTSKTPSPTSTVLGEKRERELADFAASKVETDCFEFTLW